MSEIQIDVDGLPVMVDAEEYDADPEYVRRQVQKARKELALDDDDTLEALDYDEQGGDH